MPESIDTTALLLELIKGQSAQAETLKAIAFRLEGQANDMLKLSEHKDSAHKELGQRLDKLESSRDKLFGAAIGVGLGAGAIGGGVGAVISALIGA